MKRTISVASVLFSVLLCFAVVGGIAFALMSPSESVSSLADTYYKSVSVTSDDSNIIEPVPIDQNKDSAYFEDIADAYVVPGTDGKLSGSQSLSADALQAMAKMEKVNDQPLVQASLGTAQTASSVSSSSGVSSDDSGSIQAAISAVRSATPNSVIEINGDMIPYVASFQTDSAPVSTAGLWRGHDSTTDGSWAYFIGHNPGVFSCILDLGNGSPITVYDGNGSSRTYHVIEEFDVPNTTKWSDIQQEVTSHGESVTLQTCINSGNDYRIIIAA